jgi:ABC-2 type transport system ATP-binding protein
MIKVDGLSKRYGRTLAVDNISFEVQKGQIVGFLGPNGAGKTTTMRILTCFLPPTAGAAQVAGFDVVNQPLEVKKRVGYLPENPPLYAELDVEGYLAFVGKLKGIRRADLKARIDDACERCAITDVRKTIIGKLSKGYRQRVGLAQAIIHNPDVLVLDEPTSGLDPKQIIETRTLIKHLAGEHTIILSTHILPAVEQVCEQVIVINKGQLVTIDSLDNLMQRMQGAEAVVVEIGARDGPLDAAQAQHKLEQVSGVGRVALTESANGRAAFEITSTPGRSIRTELARAVLEAGWQLQALRPAARNLEEVFLELTKAEKENPSGGDQ